MVELMWITNKALKPCLIEFMSLCLIMGKESILRALNESVSEDACLVDDVASNI